MKKTSAVSNQRNICICMRVIKCDICPVCEQMKVLNECSADSNTSLCVSRLLPTSHTVALWIGGLMGCCSTRCWLDRWGETFHTIITKETVTTPPSKQFSYIFYMFFYYILLEYSRRTCLIEVYYWPPLYNRCSFIHKANVKMYTYYSCT